MADVLKMTLQIRRDTTANWELHKDTIPAAGEPCMDTDTGLVVYGNGVDTYETLAAAAQESAETLSKVEDLEGRLENIEESDAEKNFINSVEEDEFTVDEDRKLTINEISMSKITGLPEALASKVDAVEGSRLITEKEAEKLEKLVVGEDGSVEVGGTVAAGNVDGLDEWITARAATLKGLSENNLTDELKGQIEKSQANVIEIVKVGGTTVSVTSEDKSVDIPVATALALGVVKGSAVENGISVSEDGTMSVHSLNVNKLVQTDGERICLDGGNASD